MIALLSPSYCCFCRGLVIALLSPSYCYFCRGLGLRCLVLVIVIFVEAL